MTRGGKRPGAGRPRGKKTELVAVTLEVEQAAALREESRRRGGNLSALVREIVRGWLVTPTHRP